MKRKICMLCVVLLILALFAGCDKTNTSIEKIDPEREQYYVMTYGKDVYNKIKAHPIGSTYVFGSYEQDNNLRNGTEDIEWLVVERQETRLLLVSKYILDRQPYHYRVPTKEEGAINWETCSLRSWLNVQFFNTAFSEDEQRSICMMTHAQGTHSPDDDDTNPCVQDRVFILSGKELTTYFLTNNARKCEWTKFASNNSIMKVSYWRRSGDELRSAPVIDWQGMVGADGKYHAKVDVDLGVRPAIWLELDS